MTDSLSMYPGLPFNIEVPYAMRPNLRPRKDHEPLLTQDHDFDRYQQEKLLHYGPVYGDSATVDLVMAAARALQDLDSSAPSITNDAPVWQLTRSLQEDFVIWAPNKQGQLSAQVLSVCFPSGWDPQEKVNRTFLEIHQPVPDFETVNRASEHISRMITTQGPFVRSVWTIANSGELNRRPDRCRPWTTEGLDSMWYRAERQVTIPIEGRAALFLIRVYMVPLVEIFQDPDRRQRILDSIASMTGSVLSYKNLDYVKEYFFSQRA